MLRLFLGLCAIVLLVGCSSKEEKALLKSYSEKTTYNKFLQQTEKAELFEGETSKIMVTATYLFTPNFEKKDHRPEKFIVGVAFDDSDASRIAFKNESSARNYTLTLNDKSATKVEKLALNDKRLKDISFVTEWGEYYEVTFPHINSKRFSLVLKHPKYGTKKLPFAKVAKFVYTKKGF
ncbi:MAG: hypothetical protein FAF03_10925 [Epsilonproteobacteria bacterium]|nr:hypothetical protein [Campylobacterota bacterium]